MKSNMSMTNFLVLESSATYLTPLIYINGPGGGLYYRYRTIPEDTWDVTWGTSVEDMLRSLDSKENWKVYTLAEADEDVQHLVFEFLFSR